MWMISSHLIVIGLMCSYKGDWLVIVESSCSYLDFNWMVSLLSSVCLKQTFSSSNSYNSTLSLFKVSSFFLSSTNNTMCLMWFFRGNSFHWLSLYIWWPCALVKLCLTTSMKNVLTRLEYTYIVSLSFLVNIYVFFTSIIIFFFRLPAALFLHKPIQFK